MTDRRALMPHVNKEQISNYRIRWTDGHDREFEEFHAITENFYNQLVGGPQNRQSFVPGNQSKDVKYAMIVYSKDDVPVACSGLKEHGNGDVEIKRVWVQTPFRGHHLSTFMMHELENFACEHRYKRTVLMTRERRTMPSSCMKAWDINALRTIRHTSTWMTRFVMPKIYLQSL